MCRYQSCPWVGLTHGLGWVGLGWVEIFQFFWWVGLGWVTRNGPMDNSGRYVVTSVGRAGRVARLDVADVVRREAEQRAEAAPVGHQLHVPRYRHYRLTQRRSCSTAYAAVTTTSYTTGQWRRQGGGGKLPPYGWTSKNYLICV